MLNDWISSNDEIARRCCVACVEILGPQARTPKRRSSHEHAFLESRCASDSELAATEVKRSMVIRVASCEDLQLVSKWRASHHSLRSCNAYEYLGFVSPRGRVNEKLSVEIGIL